MAKNKYPTLELHYFLPYHLIKHIKYSLPSFFFKYEKMSGAILLHLPIYNAQSKMSYFVCNSQACTCDGCAGGNTEGNSFNYEAAYERCWIRNCVGNPRLNDIYPPNYYQIYFLKGYDYSNPEYPYG